MFFKEAIKQFKSKEVVMVCEHIFEWGFTPACSTLSTSSPRRSLGMMVLLVYARGAFAATSARARKMQTSWRCTGKTKFSTYHRVD